MNQDLLEGFLTQEEPKYEAHKVLNISDNYTTTSSMEGFLKDLQGGKIMTMQEVIDDIDELIVERQALQKEVFGDVGKLLLNLNNFLNKFGDKVDPADQLKLQEKLLDIETFKMTEKINSFRDIAMLKRELRDRVAEIKDSKNRISVIDDLLEN